MHINYVSHGLYETGGYHHEKLLAETLGECMEIRFRKNFKGLFGWILLFYKAFIIPRTEVTLTVTRLFWPIYFRNLFSKNKIIVVLHNDDPKDKKPRLFHILNHRMIKRIAASNKRFALVVVSQFWYNYIDQKYKMKDNLFIFPNLFNNKHYAFYREEMDKKTGLIHLGQWSDKIDKKWYAQLIAALQNSGYICYFSSNRNEKNPDFPITYFSNHGSYLKQMALARVTIILNAINEGWNRVLHESFLVGTQVVSNGIGGLSESTMVGNGYICTDTESIIDIVKGDSFKPISDEKLAVFDVQNAWNFAEGLLLWTEKK